MSHAPRPGTWWHAFRVESIELRVSQETHASFRGEIIELTPCDRTFSSRRLPELGVLSTALSDRIARRYPGEPTFTQPARVCCPCAEYRTSQQHE
jgi:hypothetical protein